MLTTLVLWAIAAAAELAARLRESRETLPLTTLLARSVAVAVVGFVSLAIAVGAVELAGMTDGLVGLALVLAGWGRVSAGPVGRLLRPSAAARDLAADAPTAAPSRARALLGAAAAGARLGGADDLLGEALAEADQRTPRSTKKANSPAPWPGTLTCLSSPPLNGEVEQQREDRPDVRAGEAEVRHVLAPELVVDVEACRRSCG